MLHEWQMLLSCFRKLIFFRAKAVTRQRMGVTVYKWCDMNVQPDPRWSHLRHFHPGYSLTCSPVLYRSIFKFYSILTIILKHFYDNVKREYKYVLEHQVATVSLSTAFCLCYIHVGSILSTFITRNRWEKRLTKHRLPPSEDQVKQQHGVQKRMLVEKNRELRDCEKSPHCPQYHSCFPRQGIISASEK